MFNLNSFDDSYPNLLKRITQGVQQSKVENRILEIMQQAFEKELNQQHIVLSKPERARLFYKVTKIVLDDILVKMNSEDTK
jgi:hypothetical protein